MGALQLDARLLCCPRCRLPLLQFFDQDDSGFITVDELQAALKEHGDAAVVAAHINEILHDVDKDKVGWARRVEGAPLDRKGA